MNFLLYKYTFLSYVKVIKFRHFDETEQEQPCRGQETTESVKRQVCALPENPPCLPRLPACLRHYCPCLYRDNAQDKRGLKRLTRAFMTIAKKAIERIE